MDIGTSRNGGEEEFGESKGEGVAHGVDEDVGYDKREGIRCENKRTERLPEEGKVRPGGTEDIMPGGKPEKDYSRRM